MPYQMEPHRLRDRVRGKLLFVPAVPALLLAMRRRSHRTELWIGDSHAMSVNRPITNSMFMRGRDGVLILRAGARLMYSLGASGFPPHVLRMVRYLGRFGRPGALVPVFSAGEIDVRAHLAARPNEGFGFVSAYVDRCVEVARLLGADRMAFMVPVPPVMVDPTEVWFPIVGSLSERLTAHTKLRGALSQAVAVIPDAVLLDFTDVLVGPGGGMPVELTTDGSHTNNVVVDLVRARIRDSGLTDD